MYIPGIFEETRLDVLHGLMKAHPLAAFVVPGGPELLVNHMPFFVDGSSGRFGTLRGHVARANPVWRHLDGTTAVAIFQGPESYITPSWYPSKHADGKAVPTWNYAVVHAHGHPRPIEDRQWLLDHVTELTNEHEAAQALPWKVTDAPADYVDRLISGIVGIEIEISRIEGKWKVSQNRSAGDRMGVAAGLESRGDDHSRAMAALVVARGDDSSSKG